MIENLPLKKHLDILVTLKKARKKKSKLKYQWYKILNSKLEKSIKEKRKKNSMKNS